MKRVIIFSCETRSGHFGQNTFLDILIKCLIINPKIDLIIVYTDCSKTKDISYTKNNKYKTISIPTINGIKVNSDNNQDQTIITKKILSFIIPYVSSDSVTNIFIVNSVDYINFFRIIREFIPDSYLIYIHHSFSWKYFTNHCDNLFSKNWKQNKNIYHPLCFELTSRQIEIMKVSNKVVTVTKYAKKFIRSNFGICAKKIVQIYNGHEEIKLHSKGEIRRKYGFSSIDKIVLFVGRLTTDKGLKELLKGFEILRRKDSAYKLVLVGRGEVLNFVELVKPYWRDVIFTGELDKKTVYEMYSISDVGVLPSFHEQCSFTAIEMRLARIPIIVSDIEGLKETFLNEFDCLKIPVTIDKTGMKTIDHTAISQAIQRLVNNKYLSKELVVNSLKVYKDKFSMMDMAYKYNELLDF